MSALPATQLPLVVDQDVELEVQLRWRGLPVMRSDTPCARCGRTRDAEDRRLWVRGRRRTTLWCLFCFARLPLRRQLGW